MADQDQQTTKPLSIEETTYQEVICPLDDAGKLGTPIHSGRTYRVRALVHPDDTREVLSLDIKRTPDAPWRRRSVGYPPFMVAEHDGDHDDEDDGDDPMSRRFKRAEDPVAPTDPTPASAETPTPTGLARIQATLDAIAEAVKPKAMPKPRWRHA